MSQSAGNAGAQQTWEAAAEGWAKWEGRLSAGRIEAMDAMLEMAGVAAGMRVLDLASGAGRQSLRAAERVGPDGRVTACDISAAMLAHVRENARAAGLENIETIECAAEDLSISGDGFDAAICQLGLMLFPAPAAALSAVLAVLKPGARFAALVFTTPAGNAFMAEPMAILRDHAGTPPPAPGSPGIFALGGDGILEGLLADGGLAAVESRIVRAPLNLASAAEALEMMSEAFGAYRAVVADLDAAAQAAAWAEVGNCLQQFETDAGFATHLEFIIGAGGRPL